MLPEMNLACSGLAISAKKEEWKSFAVRKTSNNSDDQNIEIVLEDIYDQFKDAKFLGSLINPKFKLFEGNILGLHWENVSPLLTKALSNEPDMEKTEMGVVAQGLIRATQLLTRRYHLVITNVPYLASGKQGESLKTFCQDKFSEAKSDLAMVFVDRCLQFCKEGGTTSIVLPQNWLFLTTYRKFREKLLRRETWNVLARLGEGGFESSAAAGAFTILLILTRRTTSLGTIGGKELHLMSGLDVSAIRTTGDKAAILRNTEIKRVVQAGQLENPDFVVTFELIKKSNILSNYVDCAHGLAPGDTAAFTRFFWEIEIGKLWSYMSSTPDHNDTWSGKSKVILNPRLIEENNCIGFRYDGKFAHGKNGFLIGKMRELPLAYYSGELFDNNVHVIIAKRNELLCAIWCYFEFGEISKDVRKIDQKLDVTASAVMKVPFDMEHLAKDCC